MSMDRRRIKGRRKTSRNGPTSAADGSQLSKRLIVASLFSWKSKTKSVSSSRNQDVIVVKSNLSKFAVGDGNFVILIQHNHLVEDVNRFKEWSYWPAWRTADNFQRI